MAEAKQTPPQVLANARSLLRDAELAVETLDETPDVERRLAAFRNAIIMARAAAEMLRRLKSQSGYDEWWAPWSAEMATDPLMKYLHAWRAEVLHEGRVVTTPGTINISLPQWPLSPPPPNAVGSFLVDHLGGCGWLIQLPDGSTEKFYVALPESVGFISTVAAGAPRQHLGRDIGEPTVQKVARLYVTYISRVVQSARERFIRSSAP